MLDINSLFSSLLSINIYTEMCKLYHDDNKHTQTYIDLYNTLGSYGVHLIKDVWSNISIIVNNPIKLNYIDCGVLLEILFVKVWKHKNENVPKHCIRDFLRS
jgi:hypothetical protein